jgi:hypothetical protein
MPNSAHAAPFVVRTVLTLQTEPGDDAKVTANPDVAVALSN